MAEQMSDQERLRRVWSAFGCETNPNDFHAETRETMWRQVEQMAREHFEQSSRIAREAQEAQAEVERLRRWKAEAMAVHADWEATWQAAGRPGMLGRPKAEGVREEIARLRAALARVTDDSMAEVITSHTPTLVDEGPNGEDEGQHLYCVVCGVLPIDGLGFQDGPGHVLEQIRAVAAGEQAKGRHYSDSLREGGEYDGPGWAQTEGDDRG